MYFAVKYCIILGIWLHIVVQEEDESPPSTRRSRPSQNDDPSLFANPIKLLVVLASSIGGDRLFRNRFAVQTTAPSGLGRAKAVVNRFARDGKVPGPQLGAKELPRERPRDSAEMRHTSPQPSRYVRRKGAA